MEKAELDDLFDKIEKGEITDEQAVPVSVIKAVRAELKEVKELAAQRADENLLYKSALRNAQAGAGGGGGSDQGNQQGGNPGGPVNPVVTAIENLFAGREADDIPTVGEFKDAMKHVANVSISTTNEHNAAVSIASQKDFQEIVGTHFINVVRDKPQLQALISRIPSQALRAAVAYEIGQTDPAYIAKSLTAKTDDKTTKTEQNAARPLSTAVLSTSSVVSSSDQARIDAVQPGTPEFKALMREFATRPRA